MVHQEPWVPQELMAQLALPELLELPELTAQLALRELPELPELLALPELLVRLKSRSKPWRQ